MPSMIESKFDIDVFPIDYFDLPEETIADNIERLCEKSKRLAAYYRGRRKGVELLLTHEWAEIEHLVEFYTVSDVFDDDEPMEQHCMFNDPVMGHIISAEIDRNPALYKRHGSALIAFENGVVDAVRDAYADLQRCATFLKKDDPAGEVPNE